MTARLIAILAGLLASLALTSAAEAQDRDLKTWGGPPNLGFDYKTGNSFGVSDFGATKLEQPKQRRVVRARGNRKNPETALKSPPLPEPNPARLAAGRPSTQTASTQPTPGTATDASPVETGTLAKPIDTGPVPCRKFDPTTGRTLEIRCR